MLPAAATIIGAGVSALGNLGTTALAGSYTREDRRQNYMYNEMSAENADRRTRALYKDFYSPTALLKQYQEAGLSPSMMFGGTPGQGGLAGAQGSGSNGLQTQIQPISLGEAAQAAALFAQAEKTKAETKNVQQDTILKELEADLKEMTNTNYKTEFQMIHTHFEKDGKETSLFELANQHYTYEGFLKEVRKYLPSWHTDTEKTQQILRGIYEASNRFSRDITTLTEETINAGFQIQVIQALKEEGFIDLNAKAAVQDLKTSISVNELTETQKEAWNNVLDRLEKSAGTTTKDIATILLMIVGGFANKSGIRLNLGGKG